MSPQMASQLWMPVGTSIVQVNFEWAAALVSALKENKNSARLAVAIMVWNKTENSNYILRNIF